MFKALLLIVFVCVLNTTSNDYYFINYLDPYSKQYGHFSERERRETLAGIKEMFYFGYENYMKYAYPKDELDPIHCTGRGPDYDNPSNININDVLGDYSLTLVDTLDTLAILGNATEFTRAVRLVQENLTFQNNTVQVFEATIRILGSLLSAHLLITDPDQPFGDIRPDDYDDELLSLSHDLASRLMAAFDNTATGIPFPRVNLQDGVPTQCINETCTAGAGSLVLEFGILSRLLDDPTYEAAARRTVKRLWDFRSNVTGLLGNVINIQTGEWVGLMSGLGAGLDSFYEYLLKSYILFGKAEDLKMFKDSYETIKFHMRRGRLKCNKGVGNTPMYVNVHMRSGDIVNFWIDALQAAWSAVQVLYGDIEEAICSHAIFYSIWRKYEALPERFNWNLKAPDVLFYPLRPELIESTYFLYRATKNPFYLHVGRDIFNSINTHARAECGYGTIHDVRTKELEDRMESFFLSETCKYLYLLFDKDNHLNTHGSDYLFSTEGHIFPVSEMFQAPDSEDLHTEPSHDIDMLAKSPVVDVRTNASFSSLVMLAVQRADVTGQLQPRHRFRRERQPGARERHSSLRRRLSPTLTTPRNTSTKQTTSNLHASYCMTSASEYIRQPETEKIIEPDYVISAMKDLSTIEAIRESMKATEKKQVTNVSKQIPNWMLDLDMNLDVTAVDIIPPFEQTSTSDDATYNEQPTVTYVFDEDDDIDLYAEYPELFSHDSQEPQEQSRPVSEPVLKPETTRTVTISTPDLTRLRSPSPDGRRSRTSTLSHSSPRRYQGDKKVLSMQQGGIRSTPMQPTSTKFINQMITYTHVKVHDKKLKRVKPAIDSKMPSTFKIALDRKKLVEERFNGSYNKSYQSSTPRRRPSIKSEPSKQSKGEKSR